MYNEQVSIPSRKNRELAENDNSTPPAEALPPIVGTPPPQAGMTPEQLAEAKQYGRYSLACTLADKGLDLLFLTFAAVVLARPLDAWLQGWSLLEHSLPCGWSRSSCWSRSLHIVRFVAAFVLCRLRPGTSFPPQHALRGRLGATVFEAEPAGPASWARC